VNLGQRFAAIRNLTQHRDKKHMVYRAAAHWNCPRVALKDACAGVPGGREALSNRQRHLALNLQADQLATTNAARRLDGVIPGTGTDLQDTVARGQAEGINDAPGARKQGSDAQLQYSLP